MCDELIHPGLVEQAPITRRTFGLVTAALAAPALAATTPAHAAGITATDVSVPTKAGTADAVLFHPAGTGKWPAVLVWTDIMGLRPAFRDLGSRLAAQGYTVLVPNPFYRSKHAPVMEGPIDFSNPAQRQTLFGYRSAITDEGAADDAKAYLAFLDAQPQTATARKAGVQGYCMGGELAFRAAAAMPSRIAAVGSFHGGNGLATGKPDSPHLLIPATRATFLVCQAQNDDARDPSVKDKLTQAFAAADRPATVQVFPADHGWCVPGGKVYDQVQAERAWAELGTLYKNALV